MNRPPQRSERRHKTQRDYAICGAAGGRIGHNYAGCHPGGAGHNHVMPLDPEFIAPQDGTEKQD